MFAKVKQQIITIFVAFVYVFGIAPTANEITIYFFLINMYEIAENSCYK